MTDELHPSDGLYCGVLQLIGAILRLCAQDVKYGRTEDVEEFVESEWFEELCDALGVMPIDVKKRIFSSKVKQRSEYH